MEQRIRDGGCAQCASREQALTSNQLESAVFHVKRDENMPEQQADDQKSDDEYYYARVQKLAVIQQPCPTSDRSSNSQTEPTGYAASCPTGSPNTSVVPSFLFRDAATTLPPTNASQSRIAEQRRHRSPLRAHSPASSIGSSYTWRTGRVAAEIPSFGGQQDQSSLSANTRTKDTVGEKKYKAGEQKCLRGRERKEPSHRESNKTPDPINRVLSRFKTAGTAAQGEDTVTTGHCVNGTTKERQRSGLLGSRKPRKFGF